MGISMDIISRLVSLGWLAKNEINIDLAKSKYAAFHGVSDPSELDSHIATPRICALPDVMPIGQTVCKWPDGEITWDVVADIRGLTRDQVVAGVTEALNRWKSVCNINPQYTPGNRQARILVGSRNIDGPMGVLAESELPCGVAQCRQWYDNQDPWALFNDSGNGQYIDFVRVAMHELGHALGMNHIGGGNLMAPTYSRTINTAQAGDIAEMQARYGPPVKGSGEKEYTIKVKGTLSVEGYRLTELLTSPILDNPAG